MNTFWKIFLGVVLALIAIKLLPVVFVMVLAMAGLVLAAGLIGLSALAGVLCAAVALAAVLSPIWIPILVIVGIVALIKRSNSQPA